jgi:hypothetical protein
VQAFLRLACCPHLHLEDRLDAFGGKSHRSCDFYGPRRNRAFALGIGDRCFVLPFVGRDRRHERHAFVHEMEHPVYSVGRTAEVLFRVCARSQCKQIK